MIALINKLKSSKELGILITLLLVSSVTVSSGALISPALPKMEEHFKYMLNYEMLTKLTLTIPALFIAICSFFSGLIVDKMGRKHLLIFSAVLYSISGTAAYFLDSLTVILITRAFLGIAISGLMTVAMTLIGDYYTGEERNKVMGMQSAAICFGGVFLFTFGGILADIGWKCPFLLLQNQHKLVVV